MTTIAMTTLMKEIVRTEAVEQTNFNVDLAVVSQASGGAMVIMTVETVLMKEAAAILVMHHDSNATTGVVFTRDGYATVTMIAMMVQTKGIVSTIRPLHQRK